MTVHGLRVVYQAHLAKTGPASTEGLSAGLAQVGLKEFKYREPRLREPIPHV